MYKSHRSSRSQRGLQYGIGDRPPIGMTLILAVQHVFAMFGATILVPILVNGLVGEEVLSIPVAIVMSGVGTLIYQLCTGARSPVYLGSSFAFIAPVAAACQVAGVAGAMTGLLTVGLIYVIFALLVALIGNGWINQLLPPIVIGPMILIIGLGLASSAVSQMGLNAEAEGDWRGIVVAFITLGTAIFVMVCVRGFLNVIPFLVAIVVGYIVALGMGLVDLSPVGRAAWFSVPKFQVIFLHYRPTLAAVWQIAPVALVTMAEHIGDHKALSTIVRKDLLRRPGLARTLLGDGLATAVAAACGGPANTTYGENTAVVGMTKVASVYVLRAAAIIAIIMGFMGKLTALIATIPGPVLGGVSVLLYGFIALNGAKVWIQHKIDFGIPRNVAIAAPMLVFGLGGAMLNLGGGGVTVAVSGMSLAALFGIIANLLLPVSLTEEQARNHERENQRRLEILEKNPELMRAVETIRYEQRRENQRQRVDGNA